MGFKCGIIGLPNVGKSTIFNAMTSARAEASNYPFCTIDPNIGVVQVNDERLYKIAELVKPEKITPTVLQFVDIAGLVKGASKGEGLGNQFLGHIRSVDAIAHVVRCFDDPDVVHISGDVNPARDIDIVNTELILSDLEVMERQVDKFLKLAKTGSKKAAEVVDTCEVILKELSRGRPARLLPDHVLKTDLIKQLNLLTAKPILYVANIDESQLNRESDSINEIRKFVQEEGGDVVILCGKLESEITELSRTERDIFLKELGFRESGLDRLAKAGYGLLGLITFFTAGKKEVKAWTVPEGTMASRAAGVIHSDFERGFIRAEVIQYDIFIEMGSEMACREKGAISVEGRDYVVHDGDIIHFRFNV